MGKGEDLTFVVEWTDNLFPIQVLTGAKRYLCRGCVKGDSFNLIVECTDNFYFLLMS